MPATLRSLVVFVLLTAFAVAAAAQSVTQFGTSQRARPPAEDALLRGQVTLLGDGSPVAGARVTLSTPDLSFFRETRTLSDGSYDFFQLPRGALQLGAHRQGSATCRLDGVALVIERPAPKTHHRIALKIAHDAALFEDVACRHAQGSADAVQEFEQIVGRSFRLACESA